MAERIAQEKEIKMPLNCWEFMRCGRQPGGAHADKSGVCPASTNRMHDGIHGGKNGGRACWAVAGTFAKGNVEGTFARKRKSCRSCAFYQMVNDEEGSHVWPVPLLHRMLM